MLHVISGILTIIHENEPSDLMLTLEDIRFESRFGWGS